MGGYFFFSSEEWGTQSPSQSFLETEGEKTVRLAFERSRMQVLSLLLISFSSLVCRSLGQEGNYNEAEQSLPGNEWLNPWDMIHYDAAAQSFDNTVSLRLIWHLFIPLPN